LFVHEAEFHRVRRIDCAQLQQPGQADTGECGARQAQSSVDHLFLLPCFLLLWCTLPRYGANPALT
jgi:hypothetical protein